MVTRAELVAAAEAACAAGIPGVVAAARDGDRVVTASAGTDGIGDAGPLDASAQFRVGSIGKTALAAVVLQLVSEGRLMLDESVRDLLPDAAPFGGVTLRELLSHTSGIADFMRHPDYLTSLASGSGHKRTPEELLELAAAGEQGARGRWAYSNTNYVLVALAAERVSGARVADLLRRYVTEPLGLRRTGLEPDPSTRIARGFMPPSNPLLPSASGELVDATEVSASLGFGADKLLSTAEEVSMFLGALLGGRLLDAAGLREMTTTVPADGVEADEYGLGIALMTSLGGAVSSSCGAAWGHLGLGLGHTAIALSRRDGSRQAVLLANAGLLDEGQWSALAASAWRVYCG